MKSLSPIGPVSDFLDAAYTGIMVSDAAHIDVGRKGEEVASIFLARRGYRLVERNYRRKWGEIDIVAEKEGKMRFIEVKTVMIRKSEFSREMSRLPEELVHRTKLRKVARTAAIYMEEKCDKREYQIDVVGVIMNEETRTARCRLFEQALEDNL